MSPQKPYAKGEDSSLWEMMLSMMRFSGVVTLFGLEQIQNAVAAPTDTKAALARLCGTLDSMSGVLESKLDRSTRNALDSLSRAQLDIFDVTSSAVTGKRFTGMTGRSANGKSA